MDKDAIRSILATDCGSTTTKAILIEKRGDEFRLAVRGEAPTTVEAPAEDVTRGVLNAVAEVAELVGRPLLDDQGNLIQPFDGTRGVDLYLSTSSAGGGLQMMVAGVVRQIPAQAAAIGGKAGIKKVLQYPLPLGSGRLQSKAQIAGIGQNIPPPQRPRVKLPHPALILGFGHTFIQPVIQIGIPRTHAPASL